MRLLGRTSAVQHKEGSTKTAANGAGVLFFRAASSARPSNVLEKKPQHAKSEVWRGSSSAVPQCLVKGASLLCWGLEEIALGACSEPENRQRKEQQRQEQNL